MYVFTYTRNVHTSDFLVSIVGLENGTLIRECISIVRGWKVAWQKK